MKIELTLNKLTKGPFYVGYSPVHCTLKLQDGTPGTIPTAVQLINNDPQNGGQLVFYTTPSAPAASTLTLQLPADGTPVSFYIGGKSNAPSKQDGDAAINIRAEGKSVAIVKLMVRVRKNANDLTPAERDRFLSALVKFVQSGKFKTILDMHGEAADDEIHGRAAFLPWHRIYLLDLERHLQQIDASVTIPYWDFQKPAPNLFKPEFIGIPGPSLGLVQFADSNPLINWHLAGLPQLARKPRFNTEKDKALVEDYNKTLSREPGYATFSLLEGDPHGRAHTSFQGPINSPPTAPQDPLFFMLHANIDRLWAEWQHQDTTNKLFDVTKLDAYNPENQSHLIFGGDPIPARVGDFPDDTMWPWNGINKPPRPSITAPGGPLIDSPFTVFPGKSPKVKDAIDYQGRLTDKSLYFDYHTVPFTSTAAAVPGIFAEIKDIGTKDLSQHLSEALSENINALEMFSKSTDAPDLVTSLSKMAMFTDNENTDKAIGILKDKSNDPGMRVLALSRLTAAVAVDEQLIKYLLELLSEVQTPIDLRKEAFATIQTISFSSPIYAVVKPDIIQTLRGLINDANQDLRQDATIYLAQLKDEFVQRSLLDGLTNPEKALVPEELAVHLLGYDIHAGIYPLLRNIVEKSSNNQSRAAAIYLLAGDPQSKDLLVNIFSNEKERFDIRKNSLLALKQQHPEDFIKIAQETIVNEQENENIRALSVNAIDHAAESLVKPEHDFLEQLKTLSNTILPAALEIGVKALLKTLDKKAKE